MCIECFVHLSKTFPDVPNDEAGSFLMSVTAFPCAPPDVIGKQLRKLRKKTSDYRECYAIVDAEMKRIGELLAATEATP